MNITKNRSLLSIIVGLWIMVAPAISGAAGTLARSSVIVGFVTVVVSAASFYDVIPPARYVNLLSGTWLMLGQWFVGGTSSTNARWITFFVGAILILLNLPWEKREAYVSDTKKPEP